MKSILIQQVYPKSKYMSLIQETFTRNLEYCNKYDMEYVFFSSDMLNLEAGGWEKVLCVQRFLDYDFIVWLDADAILFDVNRDVRTVPLPDDSIGAVRFLMPVPHLNVGVLYVKPGERVKRFIHDWLDKFPGEGSWREQAVFNKIRNECIVELPKEWNRNLDNSPYANPVVMGFHGFGTSDDRLMLMRKYGHSQG